MSRRLCLTLAYVLVQDITSEDEAHDTISD